MRAQIFLGVWAVVSASVLTLLVAFFTADVQPSFFDSSTLSSESSTLGTHNEMVLVEDVIDGDTIRVKMNGESVVVRLIGIDAPELARGGKGDECFARESKARLEELVAQATVRLEGDETQQDTDRYGRLLRYVYTAQGELANKMLIAEGFAFEYTYAKRYVFADEFVNAQQDASQAGAGLWNTSVCAYKNTRTVTQ